MGFSGVALIMWLVSPSVGDGQLFGMNAGDSGDGHTSVAALIFAISFDSDNIDESVLVAPIGTKSSPGTSYKNTQKHKYCSCI